MRRERVCRDVRSGVVGWKSVGREGRRAIIPLQAGEDIGWSAHQPGLRGVVRRGISEPT